MVTSKPFHTSQTKTAKIRVTVLDYLEKVCIAIIFLNKKTADKYFIKDIS